MILWIIGGIALFILVIIIIKMKKQEDYTGLEDRLSGVKNSWSDCCKKILGKFGI